MKERDAAQKHGKAAGILVHSPALVPMVLELGYTFTALGSDGVACTESVATVLFSDVRNFTSLLRVACAVYLGRRERAPEPREGETHNVCARWHAGSRR